MSTRVIGARVVVLSIAGLAVFGCSQGTSQDIVDAVRIGDLKAVTAALANDPARVHTKVFPQAYERVSQQRDYEIRHGRSA